MHIHEDWYRPLVPLITAHLCIDIGVDINRREIIHDALRRPAYKVCNALRCQSRNQELQLIKSDYVSREGPRVDLFAT